MRAEEEFGVISPPSEAGSVAVLGDSIFHAGRNAPPAPGMDSGLGFQEPAYDFLEKSWHLCITGVVATLHLRGRYHPDNALSNSLRLASGAGALVKRQGLR
jgi:hypothetical protein